MNGEHKQPPRTVKEVGIHMGYMSDDIAELKDLLKKMPEGFATKDQILAVQVKISGLEKRLVSLETKGTIKTTLIWIGLVATTLISVFSVYELFRK